MDHHPIRVLFVLKIRSTGAYGSWGYSETGSPLPSGLSVSVQQMVCALEYLKIHAKAVQVPDNNYIHQEIEAYKPTHVIIEGFWVVPSKFRVLEALHPNVRFIIRCHSNTEFLAHEGVVFGWVLDYLASGIDVAFNSLSAARNFKGLKRDEPQNYPGKIIYLPNYYDFRTSSNVACELLQKLIIRHSKVKVYGEFHVGCFGAIRPLKNHMNQALAALHVAKRLGLKLRFYVNASRVENKGDALLRSLTALFDRLGPHKLVMVPWFPHPQFLEMLTDMDIVSQVSMSETFNIVLADAVSIGVPVIGSNIPWLDEDYQADPLDVDEIGRIMHHTWLKSGNQTVQQRQRRTLTKYVARSKDIWEDFLHHGDTNC